MNSKSRSWLPVFAEQLRGAAAQQLRYLRQIAIQVRSTPSSNESGLRVIHHGGNTLGFNADMYFLPDSRFGAVVLTNAYAANEFLAGMRQKIRELVFGDEPRSEKIIETAKMANDDFLSRLKARVKADAESTAWIEKILGTYRSAELGSCPL